VTTIPPYQFVPRSKRLYDMHPGEKESGQGGERTRRGAAPGWRPVVKRAYTLDGRSKETDPYRFAKAQETRTARTRVKFIVDPALGARRPGHVA